MGTEQQTKKIRGFVLASDPAREECFQVVHTDDEMHEWPDMSDISRRERIHRHMNNETGAMEIAAQALVDFPEAPWGLRMNLARQATDEARHADLLLIRLVEMGGKKGEFPIANFEWGVTAMLDNLPGRLAVQNRTFEAGLIDLLGGLRDKWRKEGDHETADMLESILADEITHVRFGNRWIKRMTVENPAILLKVAMAIRFLAKAIGSMQLKPGETNIVGTVWTEEKLRPPAVNVEDRLEAEFTMDEIKEVLSQAGFRTIIPSALR